MDRVNNIVHHPVWREQMARLTQLEKERVFCRHGIEHLMDVARIAYIENLENNRGIEKELIYAAALVHDIGKALQYTEGIPHEKAGASLACQILKDCGFTEKEQKEILDAVLNHRRPAGKEAGRLSELLYMADKKSRMCSFCKACQECNWSEDKKNHLLWI